jgi:hypothetical protein
LIGQVYIFKDLLLNHNLETLQGDNPSHSFTQAVTFLNNLKRIEA